MHPEQLGAVSAALGEWLATANGVLAGIEQRIDWTLNASAAAAKQRADAAAALEAERQSIRTTIELQVGCWGTARGRRACCGHRVRIQAAACKPSRPPPARRPTRCRRRRTAAGC